ncbi:MAG: hypothetical protein IK059_05155, partial [Firmicutes bacterium]|nr:hypothetical protein [Bacillota bacterium]
NEYEESVYDELLAEKKETAEDDRRQEIWLKLVDESEVLDYPEKELKEEKDSYRDYIKNFAGQYGYTIDQYASMMNMTTDQLENEIENYAKEVVKNEMLLFYIARKENITVSDEEYNRAITDIYTEQGYESEDAFKETYGKTVEQAFGKKYILSDIYLKKVMDFILENGTEE